MGVVNNNNRLQTNPANPNKTISRLDNKHKGCLGLWWMLRVGWDQALPILIRQDLDFPLSFSDKGRHESFLHFLFCTIQSKGYSSDIIQSSYIHFIFSTEISFSAIEIWLYYTFQVPGQQSGASWWGFRGILNKIFSPGWTTAPKRFDVLTILFLIEDNASEQHEDKRGVQFQDHNNGRRKKRIF